MVLEFLLDNSYCRWATEFLDALEKMGYNTPLVQKIRQAAKQMKYEDLQECSNLSTPSCC